ncbi:MAG: molybdate ABC transporter substrate-binding protein [Chloroflexi bacterium]|nr:molybdate ABC transporter substrate-binding protein [Chloroflexota bacterium]
MILFILAGALSPACTPAAAPPKTEVMIFAAMSLKQPFSQAAPLFEAENPGAVLHFNYSGSGTLADQIASGAAADVFASAGMKEMDLLVETGLIDKDTRRVFAANSLVLIAPLDHSEALHGFSDLVLPQVRRIAVCDSRLTPAGLYTNEALKYYGIADNISGKLIPCAQVAQVCDYTVRGEVDAGVVYLSDYLARKSGLTLIEQAPAAAHSKIEYPAAVMKDGVHKEYANRFVSFLCSEKCGKILSDYGFKTVTAGN